MGSVETRVFTSSVFRILGLIVGIVIILGMSRTALAGVILDEPILGGKLLVANNGEVRAKFLGSDAGYFNTLFLAGSDDPLFDKSSPLNGELSLGPFSAGTELVFRLDVRNTGKSFFSGDLLRNPDLLAHAQATTTFDEIARAYVTTVGFEDLFNGGDKDYNDFVFQLTNVIDPPGVPTPSALALIVIGLTGIGYQRRKKIKAA